MMVDEDMNIRNYPGIEIGQQFNECQDGAVHYSVGGGVGADDQCQP